MVAPHRTEGLITIENARLLPRPWRNFSGLEGTYNRAGDRNFCVVIPDPAVAEQMARDNYNIKVREPWTPEGQEPDVGAVGEPYLQVKIRYKNGAGSGAPDPQIYLIGANTRRRTLLPEDMLDILDSVDIVTSDMIISPYNWAPGKVSAYLRKLYVVQNEDFLDMKYADTISGEV